MGQGFHGTVLPPGHGLGAGVFPPVEMPSRPKQLLTVSGLLTGTAECHHPDFILIAWWLPADALFLLNANRLLLELNGYHKWKANLVCQK